MKFKVSLSQPCVILSFLSMSRFSSYHCDFYNIDHKWQSDRMKDWFDPSYQQIVADSIEGEHCPVGDEQRGILWEPVHPDLISEDTNFYFDRDGQVDLW